MIQVILEKNYRLLNFRNILKNAKKLQNGTLKLKI